MKPFYSLLLGLLLLLTAHPTRAQIVRVTNGQSLSALIASATAGITFIVEPGSYGDLTLTKRVAIIGPGYFLGNSQQATTGSATFGTITFNAGSENSILMSCAVNSYINIGANQVAVSRCLAGEIRIGYGQGQSNVSNITVKQCFVQGAITTYVGGTIDVNYSGCMIKNNIVFRNIDYNGTFQGNILYNTVIAVNDNYYGIVPNYGLHGSAYAVIKNNIANRIFYSDTKMNVINNVIYSNQTGLPTSNKVNQAPSTIFVGNNASSLEGQYMLSANSPAKGAGEGGVDCGAFGGDEPYVIGGVPSGPIIQELTVPQVTSGNTINVRVKARVQN